MPTRTTPSWLRRQVDTVESATAIDPAVERLEPVTRQLNDSPSGGLLRGEWLGHALHPVLTDAPIGCWLASGLLDLLGGRRSRPASQRLVGLGLLFVPATAVTGIVDWGQVEERRTKRVGVVHAVGNMVVGSLYLMSWRARRRDAHLRGVVLGLAGGALSIGTAYLGGHMSYARPAGTGERGLDDVAVEPPREHVPDPEPMSSEVDESEAAEILGVQAEQMQALIEGGLLVPVDSADGAPLRFERAAVLAARSVGG